MDQRGLTSEFSICLLPDLQTVQAVEAIRQTLPASPFRDDTPHISLLRRIKSPALMSDEELLQDMARLLDLSKGLPLIATVHKSINRYSPLFRVSSMVLLQASPEMKAYRKRMLTTLKASNYSVALERLIFLPHISVRLGVPYTDKAKSMAEQGFHPGAKITFNKWIILRDIKKDGKYLVREISVQ